MATKERKAKKADSQRPERKWGPFAGGCGVAVWLNEFETANGIRYARTVTFSPRRFRDPKTGEWRDGAYRAVDLAALLLAIQAAHDYCTTTPLPGDPAEPEEVETLAQAEPSPDGPIPF